MSDHADVGVFGGSGFYRFLPEVEMFEVETPFGPPSDKIAVGDVEGRRVAFLPRHGADHTIPPHCINYRANVWAMKELGASKIIAPCAVGSLRRDITPKDFVVTDDYINATSGREQTFHNGPKILHVFLGAHRYCPDLRTRAVSALKQQEVTVHDGGTVAVVNGPRFSTPAESRMFRQAGADIISMTQYPEAYLARELGLCYANIAVITDWDCGVPDAPHTSVGEIIANFQAQNEKLRKAILTMISDLDASDCDCGCHRVPEESVMG